MAFAAIIAAGCADSTQGPACVPGQSVLCTCPTGEDGAQVCNSEGTGFEPCVCAAEGGSIDVVVELACVPDCDGKDCGPDGCGETCGACDEGQECGSEGVCVAIEPLPEKKEETAAPPEQENFGKECSGDGAVCEAHGGSGRCVRGWCAPVGPGCIHASDCDDGNRCTGETCFTGRCVAVPVHGTCVFSQKGKEDAPGVCDLGVCEPLQPEACVDNSECRNPANPCRSIECSPQGKCVRSLKPDGAECNTLAGAQGRCALGLCIMDRELASGREEKCRKVRGYYGYRKKCRKGLRYLLSAEKFEKERQRVRERISNEVRYDMLVGLVELPDGGYNIVTTNLRTRQEVRGLVDPSFVAFAMASFTSSTVWKSRNLQIWLEPYREGWTIPTKGSRTAQKKGMAASGLGFLGVVNVKAYRKWLEKTFRAMPAGGSGPNSGRISAFAELAAIADAGEDWSYDLCAPEAISDPPQRQLVEEMHTAIEEGRKLFGGDVLSAKGLISRLRAAEAAFLGASEPTRALCRNAVGRFKLAVADEYLRLVAEVVEKLSDTQPEEEQQLHCVGASAMGHLALEAGAWEGALQAAMGACAKHLRTHFGAAQEGNDNDASESTAAKRGKTTRQKSSRNSDSDDFYICVKDGREWMTVKSRLPEGGNCKLVLKGDSP